VYDADKELPGEIGEESSGDSQADAQAGVGQSISMHQPLFFADCDSRFCCQDHLLRAAALARLNFCFVVSVR